MASTTPFNAQNPDVEAARRILMAWLAAGNSSGQLPHSGSEFGPYVEYEGSPQPNILAFYVTEAFWQLLTEGMVAPGINTSNMNLPWFHVTAYGRRVLESSEPNPHDPTDYLNRLRSAVPQTDATVLAYLAESLQVFRRGNHVASTILLGIAAERVFLLVCDSLVGALVDSSERSHLQQLLDRFPMKPKLDWVHAKVQTLQTQRRAGLPENALIALTTIYDLLRSQRNELGHPRDLPPVARREDSFVTLQVFPRYYEIAEEMRTFLSTNQV